MRELFSRFVGPVIDKELGLRCTSFFSNLESNDIHAKRARLWLLLHYPRLYYTNMIVSYWFQKKKSTNFTTD